MKGRAPRRASASAAIALIFAMLLAGALACERGGAEPAAPRAAPSSVARGAPAVGRSTLENRFVYAPPDEGELTVPLTLDMTMPGELSIQTPSMVAGSAALHVTYSKKRNIVSCALDARGLPYRPTFSKQVDDGTPFNRSLLTVKDARWQLWLVGSVFGRQHEDVFYHEAPPRIPRIALRRGASRHSPRPDSAEL